MNYERGDAREALALFTEAHKMRPKEARFLLSAANMHLKLSEVDEAVALKKNAPPRLSSQTHPSMRPA